MFIKCFLKNQVKKKKKNVRMPKKNNKRTAGPCAFKALQQLQKVEVSARCTLYINMLTFVSLDVF